MQPEDCQVGGRHVYYWMFLVRDRVTRLLVCEAAGRIVMIGLIVVGAQISIEAAATGYSAGLLLVWLLVSANLGAVGASLRGLLGVAARPVGCFAVVSVIGYAVDHGLAGVDAPLRLLLAWGAMAAGLVALVAVVPQVRRDAVVLRRTAALVRGA